MAERIFLVTGAYGALASRLLGLLAEQTSERVIAVARSTTSRQPLPPGIELNPGDLCDPDLWARLPRTITHVFHLAASIPWRREQKMQSQVIIDNVWPVSHLLAQAQHWPALQQIVYASSVSVYGWSEETLREDAPKRPVELYGAAKLAGEDLLLAAGARVIRVASLRYSSLFGPGQYAGTVIPTMIRAATQEGRIRIFGEGQRSQDFLHYDEAARAALLACQRRAEGVFNIGSGNAVSMTELAGLIREVFTANRAEIFHDRNVSEGEPGFRIDISKARTELAFNPGRDLRHGLMQLKQASER